MIARTQLSALDHNKNVGRIQAIVRRATSSTEEIGSLRYSYVYSKAKRSWVVKAVYDQTTQDFLKEVLDNIVKVVEDPSLSTWQSHRRNYPSNIAPIPKPDRNVMLEEFMSRFR